MTFGVRSFRETFSGQLALKPYYRADNRRYYVAEESHFGSISAGAELTDQQRTIALAARRPQSGALLEIELREQSSSEVPLSHEFLTLWPVPEDETSHHLAFVDLLTDTDEDGVSDVNERLAGTSPEDAADLPGVSTIDVLALYDEDVGAEDGGYPFTRIHHLMVLANSMYADNGTNIRLRTVAMREGMPLTTDSTVDELADPVGADLTIAFALDPLPPCPGAAGCAGVGSFSDRGHWQNVNAFVNFRAGATTAAHELGHVMGLAHSARQSEADGAFRWSRGFYLQGNISLGTIMTYGINFNMGVFSNPGADCYGRPCGMPISTEEGADAVTSLDLLRFQVAAHRQSKPDTDGDGFVDPVDEVPNDPGDWRDFDGDGAGDHADPDDDNDGVSDTEDAFPLNSEEWEDRDGDGLGDNADSDVTDLAPFRDSELRDAVEWKLGKSPGAPITDEDLAELVDLDASKRDIRNLSGLEHATHLSALSLNGNHITDLSPLAEMTLLQTLTLGDNAITDLSPLAGLTNLEVLFLYNNAIKDLSPLRELTNLKHLLLYRNAIADLSPLAALTNLEQLDLSGNAIANLSPLSELIELRSLYLGRVLVTYQGKWVGVSGNAISDISPLSKLTALRTLYLAGNFVSDISPLSNLTSLRNFDLRGNFVSDLSPFAGLIGKHFNVLMLGGNAISDISPLSELTFRELDLTFNEITDIAPIVDESVWASSGDRYLHLQYNPLNDRSVDLHIPALGSMGVLVKFLEPFFRVSDLALRSLIAQQVAREQQLIDDPYAEHPAIAKFTTLFAFGSGVSDLTGIDGFHALKDLNLASNRITDITALRKLSSLSNVDLSDNRISDISPLVESSGFDEGGWISLTGNPLNEESVNKHIPDLLERGIEVELDYVRLTTDVGSEGVSFDTTGYFSAILDEDVSMDTVVSDRALVRADVADGILTVTPGGAGGTVAVIVRATDGNENHAALTFRVKVQGVVVSMFPSASDPVLQGFARVVNHSALAGEARIAAIDDSGVRRGEVTLAIGPREVVHFNSDDLESGNPEKGLAEGVGTGEGDWRLEVASDLDLEVMSYIRTADGFLTSMHDLPPLTETGRQIAIFNPGSNYDQVSLLRLFNPGDSAAEVHVTGKDSNGASPGGMVSLSLDPGTARTVSAQQLESGEGLTGALGDGAGKWMLEVKADQPIVAISLLRSPTGHLTNLSRVPNNKEIDDGRELIHHVPLFLSAADPEGRQGFVRVVNSGDLDATVQIDARDDSGFSYEGLELTVPAGGARHFNSHDLETGNIEKGLSGSTGTGEGDWRLTFSSAGGIDVLAYIRTADGFLTSMHDTASATDGGHAVPTFNPGANRNQVSFLRIANRGSEDARVVIRGVDDAGITRGDDVVLSVPVGQSRTISAQALEQGSDALTGRMGDGKGKWRLNVYSDQSLQVTSLLESQTGHLSNLSRGLGVPDKGALSLTEEQSLGLTSFRDPALLAIIESALRKSPGESFTASELASLTTLNATGAGIVDLTGISLATGLEELTLNGNAISNLAPLAEATGLKHLGLANNAISDLTPLAGLTELVYLELGNNAVSDLSPLAGLSKLETLSLRNNAVSDISPLSELLGVKWLYLSGNAISDASPLAGSDKLLWLSIDNNAISELSFLAGLRELQWLYIDDNAISDLSALAYLTELHTLSADGNVISDLSPLVELAGLESLRIQRNPVSDLSPLSALNLESLWVGFTNVTLSDVAALPYFRDLRGLGLSGLSIDDISALADLDNPFRLSLSDNLISDVSPLSGLSGLAGLDLSRNNLEDISPVAVRSLWNDNAVKGRWAWIGLWGNPLNRESIDVHIETLRSWGVTVRF